MIEEFGVVTFTFIRELAPSQFADRHSRTEALDVAIGRQQRQQLARLRTEDAVGEGDANPGVVLGACTRFAYR